MADISKMMSMSLERIQISLGLKAEERAQPTHLQQLEESVSCSEMSHEDRLFGFALCFGAGVLLSLSSMFSFARLLRGHPRDFAVKYTVGNILAICSTAFLISPRRQFRQMTEGGRWVAAAVWIGAMVATLLSAFVTKIAAVTLLCIVVQFSAGIWYTLSYIPYGQHALLRCFRSVIPLADREDR